MVGFHEHEVQAFRSVMLDMEADMVKVHFACSLLSSPAALMVIFDVQIIVCDKRMFHQTLRQALEAPEPVCHMHTQVRRQPAC